MKARKIVTCRDCGARITFIRTPRGTAHPVDADPAKGWVVDEEGGGRTVEVYSSHFATCPKGNDGRGTR